MKVTYKRVFPIAAYGINEHIGFEIDIDESTENVQNTIQFLREQAELSFKTAHPQAVVEIPIEETRSKEEVESDTVKAIMECKTKVELEAFKLLKLLKGTSKDIFHAYEVKLKQLKN